MINGIDPVDNWHLQRWSKFTASENYKLLTPPKVNRVWSEGADSYIEDKAIQAVTRLEERPELEEVKSLLWGRVYEYPAFETYTKTTRNQITYMGSENPIFLEYEPLKEESGGTPDAAHITDSGTVDFGCEFKCPRNPSYHFKRLRWTSQWDIKEQYILCYTQIQNLMLITGAQDWHFVSFDDRQIAKSKKIKIIEVKPDRKFQDNLDIKIRMAVKEKYKILSEYMEQEVKCKSDFLKLIK